MLDLIAISDGIFEEDGYFNVVFPVSRATLGLKGRRLEVARQRVWRGWSTLD
ncbi:hypothetical protein SERLA73DRAFT_137444, partial [Serpula lacrymans var. lacrymans S7.3]